MSKDLTILVPALRRPQRVKPLLDSALEATPGAQVFFICDPDDEQECAAVLEDVRADFVAAAGNYAKKINLGVSLTQRPLIFFGADDLHFHPGWFELARAEITDKIEVVGVNDLCSQRVQEGTHATHFLVTRRYAEQPMIDGRPGPLCEDYLHNCTDDELCGTAYERKALVFCTESIVEHLHPDAGKAAWDPVYRQGRRTIREDRRLLRTRRRRGWM